MGYDPGEHEAALRLGAWITGAFDQGLFVVAEGWDASKGVAIRALDYGKNKGLLALVGPPNEQELKQLQGRFQRLRAWIVPALIGGLLVATILLRYRGSSPDFLAAVAGWTGSAVAALISCLDRRANGFELADGDGFPEPTAKKERFGMGISEWLVTRPLLGLFMGWVVYFGLSSGVLQSEVLDGTTEIRKLLFWAALAGLFSKTPYDILLGLLKSLKPGK